MRHEPQKTKEIIGLLEEESFVSPHDTMLCWTICLSFHEVHLQTRHVRSVVRSITDQLVFLLEARSTCHRHGWTRVDVSYILEVQLLHCPKSLQNVDNILFICIIVLVQTNIKSNITGHKELLFLLKKFKFRKRYYEHCQLNLNNYRN